MVCSHISVECLNQYEYFRKFRCENCGAILLCECELVLAETFLPHQAFIGHEYGTGKRIPVTGIGRVCAECTGGADLSFPRAEGHGQGGKVDRFYWHEIFKSYCEAVLAHCGGQFPFRDILDFEVVHPEIARQLKQQARKFWQDRHKRSPKYNTKERTQAELLNHISVPVRELQCEYRQIERETQTIGQWVAASGELVSVERVAQESFQAQGAIALACERRLISVWIATFLGIPIQDSGDPLSQIAMRHSTIGWSMKNRKTPLIKFRMSTDFGSEHYYERRADVLNRCINELRVAADPVALYDELLPCTELIRDYLWVADNRAVELGRRALGVIPQRIVAEAVSWAIQHFWDRQPGWPDFLVIDNKGFKFAEVKSPLDRLSQAQMKWFQWAVENAVPCELLRIKRKEPQILKRTRQSVPREPAGETSRPSDE